MLEKEAMAQAKALACKIAYEDKPFPDAENEKYFLRHSIVFGSGQSMSLGGQCIRYPGVQYLVLMYRAGFGLQSLYKAADQLVKRYTLLTLTGDVNVIFREAGTIKFPHETSNVTRTQQELKGFSQMQVVCPFYFDVNRS
jgi:hypothetical protein